MQHLGALVRFGQLRHPLDRRPELLLVHRQGDELLHARVHRVEHEAGLERLGHDEEADLRVLADVRSELVDRIVRIGIDVNDHEPDGRRARGGAQRDLELVNALKPADRRHAVRLQERRQLLPVGAILIDNDTVDGHGNNAFRFFDRSIRHHGQPS